MSRPNQRYEGVIITQISGKKTIIRRLMQELRGWKTIWKKALPRMWMAIGILKVKFKQY